MNPFRRAPGAEDELVFWRSNATPIPDDMIDPELLAASSGNQVDDADQRSLPQLQQPPQLLAQSNHNNNVEQTSVYQHSPLEWHYRNPFHNLQLNPQFNPQPNYQVFVSSPQHGSIHPHPQLDLQRSNAFSDPHANSQIGPHFHSPPHPQFSPRGRSPSRDASVPQDQPFNHSTVAYSPVSPPPDGRVFFQEAATASTSLPIDPNLMSQGNDPANSPVPGTPHLQQDNAVRASAQLAQSPTRDQARSFSRGFGQGPMEVDDHSPFSFQDEADSSPLSYLAATPIVASATMAMDLSDWNSGREDEIGLASSSPPRNNIHENEKIDATPKRTRAEEQEDLQGREGQYQRPRRYNIDALLKKVTVAPMAGKEIGQGVVERARASRAPSLVNMVSTPHDLSLQKENAKQAAVSLGIGDARRDEVMQRIPTLRPGVSFPSGVPYSKRYSDYAQPPKDSSQPLDSAQPIPAPENSAARDGQPLFDIGVSQTGNVSGPQAGESSQRGQHIEAQAPRPSKSSSVAPNAQENSYPSLLSHESYTEAVMQHMRRATAGSSESVSNAPNIPQSETLVHGIPGLAQKGLEEASVNEVVADANAILHPNRGRHAIERQQLRKLAPKPPKKVQDDQTQDQNQDSSEKDATKPQSQSEQVRFTNMHQFQPTRAPTTPTITSPLLISPYPPRIPDTFTPAVLSLVINPPRSLQLGTPDSLQSYLSACDMVPYNDMYPRTFPVPREREPFNRTVIVEARYLSVIGLLYPRAEFLVSRIAEGAEEHMEGTKNYHKKLEPNAAMMMNKWHLYKAVRMTGEEMQKMGVCVWSEKGCDEWKPVDAIVVEVEDGGPTDEERKVKRARRERRRRTVKSEVMVVDDGDEEETEGMDNGGVGFGSSEVTEEVQKENIRPAIEEEEEEVEDVAEMVDATEEEGQNSKKGKAKQVEVLQEKDGSVPSAFIKDTFASASAPASAPVRRSTRARAPNGSRHGQASVVNAGAEETPTNKATVPLPPTTKLVLLATQPQPDEIGESSSIAAAAVNRSRPIKTPKTRGRLTTTQPQHDESIHVDAYTDPYHRESKTPYLITLLQRDWPSGGVARIQCTVSARKTIEAIQSAFGIMSPYEVWRQKDYKVFNMKTNGDDTGERELKKRYIKVMRGYAGDEDTEDGMMRLFFNEMEGRMKGREKTGTERGKGKEDEEGEGNKEGEKQQEGGGDGDGNGNEDGNEDVEGKDMSTLEERQQWKDTYRALKRKGKRAVARAKGKRKEGQDMDMDFDDWWDERREEVNELVERWFARREGLVEEYEVDRQVVEFALFEYGGGDGLGLSKPYN
ncbi:hypothetical protein QBC32DRAFT_373619 [Pseudoneurospora amorphoporcata]|uniref:Uncharacterized protein n=1 Tax=Pseudoneurospora amorphoporcata TaxID=241081 RepID=A0AAN6SBQ1_9PEZI|nr:hypothetical protein QBC32DRAFT_373619 [Pseudoneurospora amorphoporcata]